MKYLIFKLNTLQKNEASCISWAKIANSFYQYPNKEGTAKYSEPIYHPDGLRVALPLLDSDVAEDKQIQFRGKLSFSLNLVDELSPDWFPRSSLSVQLKEVL